MVNEDIVETHIESSLGRLQKENDLLKHWIKDGKEVMVCSVCGKPIENVSIQRMLRPYLWCSRGCFEEKPRKIISLEHKFFLDIIGILKETTRQYGNIKAQCNALGISIPYFYAIIEKYCETDHEKFLAKHATGKRKDTYEKKVNKRKKPYLFSIK